MAGFFEPIKGEKIDDMLKRLSLYGYKAPRKSMIKTEEQIEGCREAGRVNSLILDRVESLLEVGMTTSDIDDIVRSATEEYDAIPACLGFEGFPKSVCTSPNDVICHGIPSPKAVIKNGDILNVDCTTLYGGYFGDASRMFSFGEVSEVAKRLIDTTALSLERAVSMIKPYRTTLGDLGYVISRTAYDEGFSVVREIGGHGVGLKMHEAPYVCHIGEMGQGIMLVPGMIFTLEPMVNEGKPDFTIDIHDGWTVRTKDGSLSAQIEYEILVTEDGCEILSK